ncbi:MAG: hypothetical protein NDJ89_16370 [Oligoflexia bacterium]|nr:hypothetical protein [Oligoflexia bacterium]
MLLDSDVAVLGTGVAPLVAASHLLSQGKSVLLLNPDTDFFLEDSELPFDPMIELPEPGRIRRGTPESALEQLRPEFPGAVEYWSGPEAERRAGTGFRDPTAPCVRARARLWVAPSGALRHDTLDELFVLAEDEDLNPQLMEGPPLMRRFPGAAAGADLLQGVLIPRLCDVDVSRYRIGLLEFLRERLGPERVVCGASQIQPMPGGVRFHAGGMAHTARLRDGMLVYWTPRLTQWVLAQARRAEVSPVSRPRGVRLWEQWSFISRDPIDPAVIGNVGEMAIWAELEGLPSAPANRLSVLRAGPLLDPFETNAAQGQASWASAESFSAIMTVFDSILRWNRISIRAMRPRAIFEWEFTRPWFLQGGREPPGPRGGGPGEEGYVFVVPACDGPLVEVIRTARESCGIALEVSG